MGASLSLDIHPTALKDLANAQPWMVEAGLLPDRWLSEDTRSVVATAKGEVIAAAMMSLSQMHDSHYDIMVSAAPGTSIDDQVELVRHLGSLRAKDIPGTAGGLVGSSVLEVMNLVGARTIQMVPPQSVDVSHRIALRDGGSTVRADGVSVEDLRGALTSMYLWTHEEWAPVRAENTSLIASEMGFPEDVDLESSSVSLDGEGIVQAVAVVFTDSSPQIVVAETISRNCSDGERHVEACLRRTLDAVAAKGATTVQFDGHITDPHLFPNWIKLDPSGEWFRIVSLFE